MSIVIHEKNHFQYCGKCQMARRGMFHHIYEPQTWHVWKMHLDMKAFDEIRETPLVH